MKMFLLHIEYVSKSESHYDMTEFYRLVYAETYEEACDKYKKEDTRGGLSFQNCTVF